MGAARKASKRRQVTAKGQYHPKFWYKYLESITYGIDLMAWVDQGVLLLRLTDYQLLNSTAMSGLDHHVSTSTLRLM